MSDYHLYIAIPKLHIWETRGHPQHFNGTKMHSSSGSLIWREENESTILEGISATDRVKKEIQFLDVLNMLD